jgi:hypothetical protein
MDKMGGRWARCAAAMLASVLLLSLFSSQSLAGLFKNFGSCTTPGAGTCFVQISSIGDNSAIRFISCTVTQQVRR